METNAAIITTIGGLKSDFTKASFTAQCHHFVESTCGLLTDASNDRSWDDCYDFLVRNLPSDPAIESYPLVFEFVMPESLRRADVVLLASNHVIVLEFKQKDEILKNDISQAASYGRSIKNYHFETESRNQNVTPYLVYTHKNPQGRKDLVPVLTAENFTSTITAILRADIPLTQADAIKWVDSPFYPLKNIAEATLQLFKYGTLPNIKTIRDGDIKHTLTGINQIIDNTNLTKSIIFLSGVPGSGKTLVGLKTVYDHIHTESSLFPIYLSGNDPLVDILQNTLSVNQINREGSSYIQPMKKFKRHAYSNAIPSNNIIVFDEAQRAWDIDKKEPGETEASLLLRIGDRIAKKYGKITILCLIGDGQAIHLHEESGMKIWASALKQARDWNIYYPSNYSTLFESVPNSCVLPELMLDTSIRNDFINVSPWVEAILNLEFKKAKMLYQQMLAKGFQCWIYRDQSKLFETIHYVESTYPESHTGLLVSSHMKKETEYFGKQYNGSFIPSNEAYSWYMDESKKLTRAASEFLIQGIELEYPIVGFIGDYYIENGKWVVDHYATNPGLQDLNTVIQNVYRVLLTRSRKGMFLYIPNVPKFDETYRWFHQMLTLK